ncbi:sodium- and chloride-dependent glycine transporter 2 [Galendromus occidentalis]|uniref:Transporter n=1 Tax=Galendromus occidentalis TaxID=34638 RepID=A0AAJ7L4K0_9ACAR|nr:sodium- and chloride-dependent glycine transporter 2 [Galendromus occidentalis]
MTSEEAASKADTESVTEQRERYGSRLEGILYCIGFAVGLGDVWRFPFLAYQNGGGAFFFAYIVLMFIMAIPLYTMELMIGQFCSRGPIEVWKCMPIAKGIGFAMVTVSLLVSIYYNVILAYTLYYLAQSFRWVLPWAVCRDWWNTDKDTCFVHDKDLVLCKSVPWLLYSKYASTNLTGQTVSISLDDSGSPFKVPLVEYATLMLNCSNATMSAAEMFWEREVLELSSGISEIGGLKWDLVACLFASWVIVFLCLIRGVSSSGKVVYFTATFPYVVLTILLVKGVTLDGASRGLEYFLVPDFGKLTSLTIWRRAAEQLFYSLAIGWGGLIMSGSYNSFRTVTTVDSIIVIIADLITSFLGGIAIFSVVGYMSVTYGVPIEEVAKQGQGLAFVAYPEALTTFWFPQLWSVIFFVMLYLLGIDSEFPLVQTALTVLSDAFPVLRRHRALTAFLTCVVCFLLGLTCVTRGGQYVLNLLDYYCAGVSLLAIATAEVVAIMWLYGVKQFSNDVEFMLGSKPNILFRLSWTIFSPVILMVLIGFYFFEWTPIVYNNKEPYPAWADYLGLALTAFSIVQIPIVALFVLFRKKNISEAFQPHETWGPGEKQLLKAYKKFKNDFEDLELRHREVKGDDQ